MKIINFLSLLDYHNALAYFLAVVQDGVQLDKEWINGLKNSGFKDGTIKLLTLDEHCDRNGNLTKAGGYLNFYRQKEKFKEGEEAIFLKRRAKLDKLVTKFNIELRKEDSSRAELATTYREIKALIRK